jgi:hypothetical protein
MTLAAPLLLVAAFVAITGCVAIQGRDSCIDRALTDICEGAPSWAALHDSGFSIR